MLYLELEYKYLSTMFLDNYHHLKKNEIYTLFLLVLFSIFARIPAIFIFGDTNLDNEWGVLVNNLINHGTLAINYQNYDLHKYVMCVMLYIIKWKYNLPYLSEI